MQRESSGKGSPDVMKKRTDDRHLAKEDACPFQFRFEQGQATLSRKLHPQILRNVDYRTISDNPLVVGDEQGLRRLEMENNASIMIYSNSQIHRKHLERYRTIYMVDINTKYLDFDSDI